jgi:hypothetical protein
MIADVCLILLLDSSSAISAADWQLQAAATSAAIRHPDVVGRMTSGPNGKTAVFVAEWSNAVAFMTPWTVIAGPADADRAAGAIDKHQRYGHGTADLRHALSAAKDAMLSAKTLGIECESTVVDVSGGGESAVSGDAYEEIAALVEQRAQINAIVVGGEVAVRDFYRDTVPGFVAWATWDTYAQAIRAKIMTEIGKFADLAPEKPEIAYIPVYGATRWGFQQAWGLQTAEYQTSVPTPDMTWLGVLGLGYLAWRKM